MKTTVQYILMLIARILHFIPFVHFYGPWHDLGNPDATHGHFHQKRYCRVCNRYQRRWTDASSTL